MSNKRGKITTFVLAIVLFAAGFLFGNTIPAVHANPFAVPTPTVSGVNALLLQNKKPSDFVQIGKKWTNLNGRLHIGGNVSQDLLSNGIVKAGAYGRCDLYESLKNQFDTVTGQGIVFWGTDVGACVLTFGFDVSKRIISVTAQSDGAFATVQVDGNKAQVFMRDSMGNGVPAAFTLLVY